MHRDLKAAVARPSAVNLIYQQRILNAFVKEYNTLRPHKALGNKAPANVHVYSAKSFPEKIIPWDYSSHFTVRRVFKNGAIRWGSHNWVMVATPLVGKDIGLEELGNGIWRVFFRYKLLGHLNEKTLCVQDAEGRTIRSEKKCQRCP